MLESSIPSRGTGVVNRHDRRALKLFRVSGAAEAVRARDGFSEDSMNSLPWVILLYFAALMIVGHYWGKMKEKKSWSLYFQTRAAQSKRPPNH